MAEYPPVGFHFRVDFGLPGVAGIDREANFQEVTGLEVGLGVETVKEGGENRFVHRLPLPPEYPNLVLKRGLVVGSPLIQWFQVSIETFQILPVPATVFLLNADGVPVAGWVLVNAWPVKWSVSGLNSMESGLAIDTIELAYDHFYRF